MGLQFIPTVVDKENKFERTYDIFSRLLKDRVIMVNGVVDDDIAASITSQLLYLEAVDPAKDIYMYINSPGGSVSAGLAIVDVMDYITSDVNTIAIGQACSMGSIFLACGTKGKRYVTPYSRIMVHQVSSGARGKISDMEVDVEEGKRVNKVLADILETRCGRTPREIKKAMGKDTWMSSEEAVKFGIADEVMKR